jgi:hypothetical protein
VNLSCKWIARIAKPGQGTRSFNRDPTEPAEILAGRAVSFVSPRVVFRGLFGRLSI